MIQVVMMAYEQPPFSIFTMKKNNITHPKQLVGKTLGAPVFDASYKLFPAFAKAIGIDANAVNKKNMDPRLREPMLIRGEVDAISGHVFSSMLNLKAGGPGFQDFKYTEAYAPIYQYITPDTPELWRRSIYRFVVRTTPHEFLTTLDCPDPANFTPKRLTTTTPLQALTLSNNPFMLKQAGYFAERLEREAGKAPAKQVRLGFALAFGRPPSEEEQRAAETTIKKQGLFALCHVLLNANEFVYID